MASSKTKRAVQPQFNRGLKFRIKEEEELYYLCSKNKGAILALYSYKQKSDFLATQFKWSFNLLLVQAVDYNFFIV